MNPQKELKSLYETKFICKFCKKFGASKSTSIGQLGYCIEYLIWLYEFNPKCKEYEPSINC